jgi:hypothetical protein
VNDKNLIFFMPVREGSDGEGKKVDPRCPNKANPFHVCTDHCLDKIIDAGRSSEGGKSPISLFSRRSGRSTSSSEGCSFASSLATDGHINMLCLCLLAS